MVSNSNNIEILDTLLQVLTKLGTDPKTVPLGDIRQLRGALQCVDLEGTKNIDSVLLLSNIVLEGRETKHLYKLDYALRGDIKGILRGRKITQTKLDVKGWFKKKIEDLQWILPVESRAYALDTEGIPPKPGEIWINGPHQTIADKLNQDRDLYSKIVDYLKEKNVHNFVFTIFSDRWGESLRLSGNIWLKLVEMIEIYASHTYLEIVSDVFDHLKEVRRRFGGLSV